MKKVTLRVLPDSTAEKYFMNEIMPVLKDGCSCRLGAIFGVSDKNEYDISEADYRMCKKLIKKFNNGY